MNNMIIQQISVFVENKPGAMCEVLTVLKEKGINLRALSLADTADFGIIRLIVKEPDKVEQTLKAAGFAVKMTPVLAIKVPDDPGGLFEQVQKLSSAGINIEYMYAFAANGGSEARVVLKVDDLERAELLVCGEKTSETSQTPNFYW
jgi:hypothetical protein